MKGLINLNLKFLIIISLFIFFTYKIANAASFNSSLLVGQSSASKWNSDIQITPGNYNFDIYVNDRWIGVFPIDVKDGTKESIFVNYQDLFSFGLKLDNIDIDKNKEEININDIVSEGTMEFDPNGFKIKLIVPQAYVYNASANWVPKNQWDEGINAAYLNYNVNYYDYYYKKNGKTSDSLFMSLNGGINLFGYHFIEQGNFYSNDEDSSKYENTYRYLEKPLIDIDSVLRLGKQSTYTGYFDTNNYIGGSLRQDTRMLPDSYGTYMPVIRGVAAESGVIIVYQDNKVIEQINIPAGQYEIDDLMPSGSRSDLKVEIKYVSGRIDSFTVPFSTVSGMLRANTFDYNINVGQLDYDYSDDYFIQGEYSQGINNYLTGYGGLTFSDDYQSYLIGSAISIPHIGSFSFDIEASSANLEHLGHYSGQKYKLSYSKYFSTKTNLTLASYYYQTDEYLSLREAKYLNEKLSLSSVNNRTKERYTFNVSQSLPYDLGYFYFDGYFSRRMKHSDFDKQFSLSYSKTYKRVNYSLTATRLYEYDTYSNYDSIENRFALSVSIPIDIFGSNTQFTARTNFIDKDYQTMDVSLSGTDGINSYSINGGHDRDSKAYASVYGSHRGESTYLNGSYGESEAQRQVSLGMSGSLVAYNGGLLASSQNGSNFVIIETPGIEGVVINNDKSIVTNRGGKALVPSATAYRKNSYRALNTEGDGEILGNMKNISPVKGSVSKITYTTDTRQNYIFKVTDQYGNSLPFGSDVLDEKDEIVGYVLQGGLISIRNDGFPDNTLKVKYHDGNSVKSCLINPVRGENNTCL